MPLRQQPGSAVSWGKEANGSAGMCPCSLRWGEAFPVSELPAATEPKRSAATAVGPQVPPGHRMHP